MRDIPIFATENGVGSLILKEIPYSATAYVRIQDTLAIAEFLDECVSFCRVVGAEHIYASGHPFLECYPFHTAVLQMVRSTDDLPYTDAVGVELTEETLEEWRQIYNRAMNDVANASYMTSADAKQMRLKSKGYYIKRGEDILGIGMASGNTIEAVASVVPGAGQDIMLALIRTMSAESVFLQVASSNVRAVKLYKKLGFTVTDEISRWYKIF